MKTGKSEKERCIGRSENRKLSYTKWIRQRKEIEKWKSEKDRGMGKNSYLNKQKGKI